MASDFTRSGQPASDPLRNAMPLEHPEGRSLVMGGREYAVPAGLVDNLRWRRRLVELGETSESFRKTIMGLCSQPTAESCLFWINGFAWTYAQKEVGADGVERSVIGAACHRPMITWPCQDRLVREVVAAIQGGRDLLVDKSRDMGASWIILTVFHWYWQFFPNVNFLEISRKEELVDDKGNPKSLFWKHDYLNARQPGWMLPPIYRADRKMVNAELESSVTGETTTEDVGHGGRVTAALVDEIARIRQARMVWEGLADTTSTRIGNSTPHGPVFWSELLRSGTARMVSLPWWEHPLKGRGRYSFADPETGEIRVSSPWRDARVRKAATKREIAENVDMDHEGSGQVVFSTRVITRHIANHAEDPLYIGDLRFEGAGPRSASLKRGDHRAWRWVDRDAGSLRLWCELEDDGDGLYRPVQGRTYGMGVDIATGQNASNSVASIGEFETGRKVGELCTSSLSPEAFARLCVAVGLWFGGSRGCAFIIPERNGPGGQFIKVLRRLGYRWIFKARDEHRRDRPTTVKFGWFSTPDSKADLMNELQGAYEREEFVNPSRPALEETLRYVYDDFGTPTPGTLIEENTNARRNHGDRTIADALLNHGRMWARRSSPPAPEPPKGSIAWRRKHLSHRKALG